MPGDGDIGVHCQLPRPDHTSMVDKAGGQVALLPEEVPDPIDLRIVSCRSDLVQSLHLVCATEQSLHSDRTGT